MPDLLGILRHRPVGGKNPAAGNVVQAHAVPHIALPVGLHHALLSGAVGGEIRQKQIRILLQQALINIISNSVKYTKNGGRIEVSAVAEQNGVLIIVRDNGLGIPKEDIPWLFERFYRVEKERTSDAGGTGLGLAIVKNAVRVHGGTISVKNNPGGGLCFEFSLKD